MSEKGSSMWLKALAVTSAVALAGGYVVWKDGQAKEARIEALEQRVTEWEKAEEDLVLLPGPKSIGGSLVRSADFEGQALVGPDQNQLMPSSKSGVLWSLEMLDKEPEEEPPRFQVLPGSKSFSPIFDTPQTQEDKP